MNPAEGPVPVSHPRVRLGASPLEVAPLGVGCWAWGDRRHWQYEQDHGPRDVVDAFSASVAAGIDFFDTAEVYGMGKSEQLVGALVRRSPSPLIVATKYAPLAGRGGARAIAKGLAGSLRRLGLGMIDLYQIHWADSAEVAIADAMDAFADAVESGAIRAVGVSNFRAAEMRAAHEALARRGIPLASNQVRYSLLHRSPEVDGVLAACRELDVALLAYSPLDQGLLTGKYRQGVLPTGPRAASPSFEGDNVARAEAVLDTLRTVADSRGVTPAAVALRWLIQQPGVVPLAGAKRGEQAAANAAALRIELSSGELQRLDEATTHWRVDGIRP